MGSVYFSPLEIQLTADFVLSFASCRLAPMRLYTLSKRHFVLVFVVFFVCFGLTVFIGIAGKDAVFKSFSMLYLNMLEFTDVFKC